MGIIPLGTYLSKSKGFREHSEAKYYGVNLNFKFELFKIFFFPLLAIIIMLHTY